MSDMHISEIQNVTSMADNTLYVLCNANAQVGYGHFFRCLSLAQQWQRITGACVHWIGEIDETLHSLIHKKTADIQVISNQGDTGNSVNKVNWPTQALKALDDSISSTKPFVLCDSYLIDNELIDKLSARSRLILIEDFGTWNCQHAFAVINFTVAASKYSYLAGYQLLGAKYFLCSPSLDEVRQTNLSNIENLSHSINHITVAIGGFDRHQIGTLIVKALLHSKFSQRVTLLGQYEDSVIKELTNFSHQQSVGFTHIVRSENMAEIYKQSDLLISGGGLTKYESAYCGIPNVVVAQTQEQLEESAEFEKLGLCRAYGSASQLASELAKELLSSKQKESCNDDTVAFLTFNQWLQNINWKHETKRLRAASREIFSDNTTENVVTELLRLATNSKGSL